MDTLGRYEIVEELGRGAMGIVYRGNDPKINRTVALKCLHAKLLEDDTGIGERFQQEMRALGRLVHPNIVTIFDAGEETGSGRAYIVMEYVEGISLAEVIKSKRGLSIDQIVHIGIQICRGLDFAHSRGIVHRDIKPGNILLSDDLKNVKIADFGIARLDDTALTRTDCLTGTPQYMSPEQCRGDKLDGRSDLFALGVLLYELLTKTKAFQGKSFASIMMKVLGHTPDAPATLSTGIPEPLSTVVMQALEKMPEHRFASGDEMADALFKSIEKPVTLSHFESKTQVNEDNETKITSPFDLPAAAGNAVVEEKPKPSVIRYAVLVSILLVLAGGLFFVLQKSSEPTKAVIETEITSPTLADKENRVEAEREAKELARIKAEAEAERLKLSSGLLLFETTPSGADILINGELMGSSPMSLQLSSEQPYELLVVKKGYHALEATIDVPAGESTPINLTLLAETRP